MFAAQSSAFARFLLEREGPLVLGELGRGYVAGKSFGDMIVEFHNAPRSLAEEA